MTTAIVLAGLCTNCLLLRPWSYLCASLAVGQLLDYAAFWHALYEHDWFEHVVLAKWPPPSSPSH